MPSEASRGFTLAIAAAFLWSAGGLMAVHGFRLVPEASSLSGTLVRVAINLLMALAIQFFILKQRRLPWGDGSLELWLWGLLGACTIVTYFASMRGIGPGEATLLQGVQGLVVAILAPYVLGQKGGLLSWLAVLGGLCGITLVLGQESGFAGGHWVGRSLALVSGLCAGAAYLLLSRSKGRHHPASISFYWSFVSLLLTGTLAFATEATLPTSGPSLPWLFAAGIAGSLAQWLTTLAYKFAPAAIVSASSYLVPGLSLLWEVAVDHKRITAWASVGCVLVLACGMALPMLCASRVRSVRPRTN